jgi:hypothetical protein
MVKGHLPFSPTSYCSAGLLGRSLTVAGAPPGGAPVPGTSLAVAV